MPWLSPRSPPAAKHALPQAPHILPYAPLHSFSPQLPVRDASAVLRYPRHAPSAKSPAPPLLLLHLLLRTTGTRPRFSEVHVSSCVRPAVLALPVSPLHPIPRSDNGRKHPVIHRRLLLASSASPAFAMANRNFQRSRSPTRARARPGSSCQPRSPRAPLPSTINFGLTRAVHSSGDAQQPTRSLLVLARVSAIKLRYICQIPRTT